MQSNNIPPPPPRGKNPALIFGGICVGCLVVIIVLMVVVGSIIGGRIQGFNKSLAMMDSQSILFLNDIKSHKYADAESLMTLDARKTLPENQLRMKVEDMEKQNGTLKSFSVSNRGARAFAGLRPRRATGSRFFRSYMLKFANSSTNSKVANPQLARIGFEFVPNNPKSGAQISSFEFIDNSSSRTVNENGSAERSPSSK